MRFYLWFFVSLITLLCPRLPAQALREEVEQLLLRRTDSALAKALHTLTIPQLQQAMDTGTLGAEAMVSFYLAQIQQKTQS